MFDTSKIGLHLTAAVALFTGTGLQAQTPTLLTTVTEVSPDVRSWEQAQRRDDLTLTGSRFVSVSQDLHAFAARPSLQPRTYSVELFGETREIEFRQFEQQLDFISLRGEIKGMNAHDTLIVLTVGRGIVSGVFEYGDIELSLAPTGIDGVHTLFTRDSSIDTGKEPCEIANHDNTEAQAPALESQGGAAAAGPSPDGITTVDVATFYTPAARSGAGGVNSMENAIANRISIANSGNTSSAVDIAFRLVHIGETAYTETGSSTDVNRFRNTSDGFMDEVHAIRNAVGADLMTLIINNSGSFCGVAYSIMCSPSANFRTSAFSVTVRTCLSNRSFAHEMGHTMGLAHDRANAGCGAYSYSYGARTSNNQWRSLMAYSPGTRVQKWSGPNVIQSGLPLGTATEDNARTLNNVKDIVASFKPTVVGSNPPTLTGLSPSSTTNYVGVGTNSVTVTGTDLDTVVQVNLGSGTVPIQTQSAGSLTFTVPKGYEIGSLQLTVDNFSGTSNALSFQISGSHPSVLVYPAVHTQGSAADYDIFTDAGWTTIVFVSDSNLPSVVPNLVNFGIGNNFTSFFQFWAALADNGGRANLNLLVPSGTVPPFSALYYQAITFDTTLTVPLELTNASGVIYF